MATVQRLIEQAQSEKPRLVTVTDRLAVVFVSVVLVLATSVGIFWWFADSSRWLAITVAMLVVSCPMCVVAGYTNDFYPLRWCVCIAVGVLPVRNGALETLARVDHIVFDKDRYADRSQRTPAYVIAGPRGISRATYSLRCGP